MNRYYIIKSRTFYEERCAELLRLPRRPEAVSLSKGLLPKYYIMDLNTYIRKWAFSAFTMNAITKQSQRMFSHYVD